jgi:hypothetical protein
VTATGGRIFAALTTQYSVGQITLVIASPRVELSLPGFSVISILDKPPVSLSLSFLIHKLIFTISTYLQDYVGDKEGNILFQMT